MREGLTPVRDILRRTCSALLAFVQVLKRLALYQIQYQIPFVRTRREAPRVSQHHLRIIETARVVIHHNVEQLTFRRLSAHIDVIAVDVVVELAYRYLQLRTLLP